MSIVTLPLPQQLVNGTLADAGQVMTDLNSIASNVNANAAKNGVNSDITQLTALTSIVSGLSLTGASLLNCSFTSGTIVASAIDSTTTGITQALGTNTTQLATTAFVAAQAFSGILPALAAPTGASLIGNQPAGTITATTVQAALNYLDTKTAVTISSVNGGQLAGLRNRIINGDMRIDQRNNGAAVTPGTGSTYILDRHVLVTGAASKLTVQQVVDAPPGFKFSTKLTVNSQYSAAAAEEFSYRQNIEGQNIVDYQFGLATAQTLTYSFWVKSSIAGTYSMYATNGPRSYVANVSVTTAWVKQTVTLVADTAGTWATDNTTGLFIGFDLGSGTNFNETPGTWQTTGGRRTAGSVAFVNQVNGSTLNITGVQLELGGFSTPFEQRTIGIELGMCQRYFENRNFRSEGNPGAGLTFNNYLGYACQKRATPTITIVSPSFSNASTAGTNGIFLDGVIIGAIATAGGQAAVLTQVTVNCEL